MSIGTLSSAGVGSGLERQQHRFAADGTRGALPLGLLQQDKTKLDAQLSAFGAAPKQPGRVGRRCTQAQRRSSLVTHDGQFQ